MMETLAQWDGPATLVLALFVAFELREMRKTTSRLVELLARQDERERIREQRRGRHSRPPMYATQTPAHGVPMHIEPEESTRHER